jgi:hypothetical protein
MARDLEFFETTCTDIGFQKGTPAYGECVLELDRRANSAPTPKAKPAVAKRPTARSEAVITNSSRQPEAGEGTTAARGDGSPDDFTCGGYGFRPGTDAYADCRMKLDTARAENYRRQREFEDQQRQYQAQVAEIEQEQKRKAQQRKARCHFASAASGSATFLESMVNLAACEGGATGPVAVTPPRPPPPAPVQCFVNGNVVTCY